MERAPEEIDQPNAPQSGDPLGTRAVFLEVVKKLSSQALLFGLAVILVVVVARYLFGAEAYPVIVVVLVVFLAAFLGYLFVEEKRRGEAFAWMGTRDSYAPTKPDNTRGHFTVELWTEPVSGRSAFSRDVGDVAANSATYRIGDAIVTKFRATRDCYLTLLNLGTSGRLTVLFPNAHHRDNFVRAGELHHIPEDSSGFEYRLEGPPGIERLKAVATLSNLPLIESDFTADGGLFSTRPTSATPRDIAVVRRRVEQLRRSDWTEATTQFAVASG